MGNLGTTSSSLLFLISRSIILVSDFGESETETETISFRSPRILLLGDAATTLEEAEMVGAMKFFKEAMAGDFTLPCLKLCWSLSFSFSSKEARRDLDGVPAFDPELLWWTSTQLNRLKDQNQEETQERRIKNKWRHTWRDWMLREIVKTSTLSDAGVWGFIRRSGRRRTRSH